MLMYNIYQQVEHAAVDDDVQALLGEVAAHSEGRRLNYRRLADTSCLGRVNPTQRWPHQVRMKRSSR